MIDIVAVLTRWDLDAGGIRERMYRAPSPLHLCGEPPRTSYFVVHTSYFS